MGPWICSMFCFFCCVFFYLVCDPKLILQISGTFQQTCWKLHHKTEEADNAVKEVLSKLSSCCDELGKIDLDDSTLKTCVVKWLHRWKLLSGMRWKYQCIRLTFVLPAMRCCCCILVLGILRLARSWSCSTFFDYLNSVLHPLVERTSENLDGMLKMCRHSITRPLQSVFRNRKPAFRTPGFPEKICTVLQFIIFCAKNPN